MTAGESENRPSNQVTVLLAAIGDGDRRATDELLLVVYDELRSLARQRMAHEPVGHTLQGTALVHEAYLRLIGDEAMAWDSRGHFFAAAAQAMRRILIERARRYQRHKHGGGRQRVDLEHVEPVIESEDVDLVALDDALRRLEQQDSRMAQIVNLRYFAGLSVEDTAAALDLSPRTVKREWACARAWLHQQITEAGGEPTADE